MSAEPRVLQFPRRLGAASEDPVVDDADAPARMLRRALCAVTPIITGAVDESFLTALVYELVSLFGATRGSVMLLDVAGDAASPLRIRAAAGLPPVALQRVADKDGVAARVVRNAKPTLIFDRADRDVRFIGVATRDEVGAAMCAPIATPTGVVFGVLNLSRERGAGCAGFSRGDLEICDAVAMLVGDALERLQARKAESALREQMRAVERLTMMGEVAAGIAHEVAAPMACVRINLATLVHYMEELKPFLQVPPAGPAAELHADLPALIADIALGVHRAEQVMASMKALARLQPSAPATLDLQSVVDGAVRLVRPRLRANVVVDVDPVSCMGREVDLIQVLVNLLVNADDAAATRLATDPQGPAATIHIRARADDDAVVIDIEDNGTGITPANLERVFQPLFTTKPGGTGLGLSISRRLVEEQGGRLAVDSTPGTGTTFHITLLR